MWRWCENRAESRARATLARLRLPARVLAIGLAVLLTAAAAFPEAGPATARVVTDRTCYNAGSLVRVKLVGKLPASEMPVTYRALIRYAGSEGAVAQVAIPAPFAPLPGDGPYVPLWKIPATAATGRYEIEIRREDSPLSNAPAGGSAPLTASFVVHRKLVRVEDIRLDKTFYVPGDFVGCRVRVRNISGRSLRGLRVEFSDRYWPWIAGPAQKAQVSVVVLADKLDLPAGASRELRKDYAARVAAVQEPSTHQYAVSVWDAARQNVLDIAFSPLTFVRPAGSDAPRPYPSYYVYPNLGAFKIAAYRHFYPPTASPAIQFDTSRTMFTPGADAELHFSVANPTAAAWRGVAVRARLLRPDGSEAARESVFESLNLPPGQPPALHHARFKLPPQPAGIYRAEVDLVGPDGTVLASNALELGVNPLPQSLMIFCAHEDDEGGYNGLARAAVENHVPLHYVYFTSGDAGSCDIYFGRSCGPAEALDFGGLRMDETRAALGHLGVPPEAIFFLGLPDGGSGQIWYHHRGSSAPFLDVLLATDHAPFAGLVHPNLPYARDAVVDAVKELIRRFHPAMICTAHPQNVSHIDHIVNNYFVVRALQELVREGTLSPDLTLLVDKVRDPRQQPLTPYRYQEQKFFVSGEVAALAQEAGWFYQSQGGNRAQGDLQPFGKLERQETFRQILDWNEHQGWNENNDPYRHP
jgi:LmbE family N-acetylglucosaminyl deacetylase